MLGETCSHGIKWSCQCRECDLVSAKEFVLRWGPMVDEARAKIADAEKPVSLPPKRYKVEKKSGSQYAYVVDTETGLSIKRYNIFKGDGWSKADKHAIHLNSLEDSAAAHAAEKHAA
jgi:hypothetical protein